MHRNWIVSMLLVVMVLLLSACAAMGPEPQTGRAMEVALGQAEEGASDQPEETTAEQVVMPDTVLPFVTVNRPLVALTNVRVIDGTGAEPLEDQTILISEGKIEAVGATGTVEIPAENNLTW